VPHLTLDCRWESAKNQLHFFDRREARLRQGYGGQAGQALLCFHASCDEVKDIIQHEEWNDSGHHTGTDRPCSEASHTEQGIENPAEAGKRQPFHDEPDYVSIRHDNLDAS
jgi:hypothetical protein